MIQRRTKATSCNVIGEMDDSSSTNDVGVHVVFMFPVIGCQGLKCRRATNIVALSRYVAMHETCCTFPELSPNRHAVSLQQLKD